MELLKKHSLTALSLLSIVLLAFPLATVECAIEVFGSTTTSATSVTGFSALGHSVFAYILIAGPILLIAMNYIKQLEAHKGLLAIIIPIICLVALIIVVLSAKNFSISASNDYASTDVGVKIGFGAILVALTHIATIVAGAVTYHNFTLDKAGLGKLKDTANELIGSAQDKLQSVSYLDSSISARKSSSVSSGNSSAVATTFEKTSVKKPVALHRVDEILILIEKMAKLKDAGVLTEDEFANKKKQLLEEIQ